MGILLVGGLDCFGIVDLELDNLILNVNLGLQSDMLSRRVIVLDWCQLFGGIC